MKILILGGGKVGEILCKELADEKGIDITLIERNERVFERIISRYDVDGMCADGSDIDNLIEAGVRQADVFISVSQMDEVNLISATLAGRLGAKFTVARVRSMRYNSQVALLKESLGISMIVNPDYESAKAIARVIRFPHATNIENFHKYHVEIVGTHVDDNSVLKDMTLIEFGKKFDLLLCIIERGEEVFIPRGSSHIKQGDVIHVTGTKADLNAFYSYVGYSSAKPIKSVLIVGGGKLTTSLLSLIKDSGFNVKVIENKRETAEKISEDFDGISVIHGDGTDQEFLNEENLEKYDCSLSLTGVDEENLLISMYAKKLGVKKIITKLNRSNITKLLTNELIHTVVTPKRIIADIIISFVRSKENLKGSNIEEMYTIAEGAVEALQFHAKETSKTIGKTLLDLPIKKGVLVVYIIRHEKVFFPRGRDTIERGDRVVIVTTIRDFTDLDDILENS